MDVFRQFLDRAFPPAVACTFPSDELADDPVKLNQNGVDGRNGARPRRLDSTEDELEVAGRMCR